jgi:hypothetical protein
LTRSFLEVVPEIDDLTGRVMIDVDSDQDARWGTYGDVCRGAMEGSANLVNYATYSPINTAVHHINFRPVVSDRDQSPPRSHYRKLHRLQAKNSTCLLFPPFCSRIPARAHPRLIKLPSFSISLENSQYGTASSILT